METVDNMKEWLDNMSRDMETLRKKKRNIRNKKHRNKFSYRVIEGRALWYNVVKTEDQRHE